MARKPRFPFPDPNAITQPQENHRAYEALANEALTGQGPPPEPASPAEPAPIVAATATRCPKCGSTRRNGYHHTRRLDHGGTAPDGRPYTAVYWRRTECADCGQARVDKSYAGGPE